MKGKFSIVSIICLLIVYSECARQEILFDQETEKLAKEYRALRKQPSHWKGGKWNEKTDPFNSRLHVILTDLGKRLGNHSYSEKQITELLGAPDAVRKKNNNKLLIYFWRSWHDYLYFISKEGIIQRAEWYFAYE